MAVHPARATTSAVRAATRTATRGCSATTRHPSKADGRPATAKPEAGRQLHLPDLRRQPFPHDPVRTNRHGRTRSGRQFGSPSSLLKTAKPCATYSPTGRGAPTAAPGAISSTECADVICAEPRWCPCPSTKPDATSAVRATTSADAGAWPSQPSRSRRLLLRPYGCASTLRTYTTRSPDGCGFSPLATQ